MDKSKPADYKRIVIVAYRLPFSLKHRNGKLTAVQNTGGLVSAVLSLTQRMKSGSQNEAMARGSTTMSV